MKNISCPMIISALIFLLSYTDSFSQDNQEGVIMMEITAIDSEDQQLATQLQMMKGSETIYYFNQAKSLVINSMMGGMILFKKMTNNNNDDITLLIDAMGEKTIIESTKEERDKLSDKKVSTDGLVVKYDESDTKKILDYDCIKATISGEDSPLSFECYVAPELSVSNKIVHRLESIDLKGFPLEYTIKLERISMTYKAVEIEAALDVSVFNLDTEGYEKKSMEEFEKEMSALGNAGF